MIEQATEPQTAVQETESPPNGSAEFAALVNKARNSEAGMTPADLDLAQRLTLMYGRGPKNRQPYPEEIEHYLHCIRKYNLDPMQRQICAVWRWDKTLKDEVMTVQTQIDGYRVIASRTGQYAGSDDPTFNYDEKGNIVSCTQQVWRIVKNVRCPFTATAYWSEYKPGGAGGFMWGRMGHCMIAKCAEALALRKAFPADLSGLYVDVEMDQSEAPVSDAPQQNPDAPTALPRGQRPEPKPKNPGVTVASAWYKLAKAAAKKDPERWTLDGKDLTDKSWAKHCCKTWAASVVGHDVPSDPREWDADITAATTNDLGNQNPLPLDERD